jgi:hypothetical protein
MSRVGRLLLCTLLATPAFAFDNCSMDLVGQGTGIGAASCCGSSCTCPSAGQGESASGESSLDQCPGVHGAGKTDLVSGNPVKTTLESRSDLVPLPAAHPAAAQDATPGVTGDLALELDRSALPFLHREAFELFCTFLI